MFLLSVGMMSGLAQEKKNFTLQEAILGYHLYPKGLSQLQWVDDYHFAHVVNNTIQVSEIEKTKNGLVKSIGLNELEVAAAAIGLDSLKRIPRIEFINANEFKFIAGNNAYKYLIGDRKMEKMGEMNSSWEHTNIHSTTQNVAYVFDQNLYVYHKSKPEQITLDGGNGIVYGQAVHRNEFGINGGTFWSPKGSALAFYRMDESMVTDYPIYDLNQKPAAFANIKYPVAGEKSHHVTVGVYHLATGRLTYLQTGLPEEQYLTNISWSPDEKYIYIAVVNRAQDQMSLRMYDAASGRYIKTLFEERNARYVEPEHPVMFVKNQEGKFIWQSERDGYNHVYLYDTSGRLLKQVTSGNWVVTEVLGFDASGDKLFIMGTKESPLSQDLYCYSLKSGKSLRLSNNEGTHRIKGSPNNVHFIDQFSNTLTPMDIRILTDQGEIFETIHQSANPLEAYNLGEMSIGTIKADDGTDLYYRLFKPSNFDPTKKYPVVVYLYGGPHLQLVTNTWLGGANLWYQYLAQQGFVVFSLDCRGSANRGFAFESAVHRQMATLEMEDHISGVNWLKSQTWVDGSRMGVHGWSYGGFMTTSLMTRKPGVFKVGVAGGPVIDWKYYEVMYTERYMDTPQENPEGYQNNNLLGYVDKLEGKLLMIHGTEDDVVLWQHSLMYVQKAVESGVTNLDYFVYPNHKHNVYGKDRLHLYQKVTEYLIEGLK